MPKHPASKPSKKGKDKAQQPKRSGSSSSESDSDKAIPAKKMRKAPKRNKAIWQFYKLDSNFIPDAEQKHAPAICNACKKEVKRSDGSPDGMKKHLKHWHPDIHTEYLWAELEAKKAKKDDLQKVKELEDAVDQESYEIEVLGGTQTSVQRKPKTATLDQFWGKAALTKYANNSDLQRRAELDMAAYICTSNLAFYHVETEAFKRFVKAMNPKVQVKSPNTLVRKQIPILLENMKQQLGNYLEAELPKVIRIAFTTDGWSSRAMHDYLSLTLHIIDTKFELRTFTIACRSFEERHTGEEIMNLIDNMIQGIDHLPPGIDRSMVTDGASNMKKAFQESLQVSNHLICLAHIISNCLKDAFEVEEVKKIVQRCKDLASITHKSVQKTTRIRARCCQLSIPFKKIVQPVSTRWNSVTMCIDSILRIQEALKAIRDDREPLFIGKIPTDKQFEALMDMLPPLLKIKAATEVLESDKKPTLHLVIPTLIRIGSMSKTPKFQETSPTTKRFILAFETALEKRVKRHGKDEMLYCAANFLNPFHKANCLTVNLEDEEKQILDNTIQWVKDQFPHNESRPKPSNTYEVEVETEEDDWDALGAMLKQPSVTSTLARSKSLQKPEASPIEIEIDFYLNSAPGMKTEKDDVLAYWRKQKEKLPLLASLARALLSTPATSASSERLFSKANNIVSAKRTLLNTEMAEDLIFIQANYEAIVDIMTKKNAKWRLRMTELKNKDKLQPSTSRPDAASDAEEDMEGHEGHEVEDDFVNPENYSDANEPELQKSPDPKTCQSPTEEDEDDMEEVQEDDERAELF